MSSKEGKNGHSDGGSGSVQKKGKGKRAPKKVEVDANVVPKVIGRRHMLGMTE